MHDKLFTRIAFVFVPIGIFIAGLIMGGSENPATAFGWTFMYYAFWVFAGLLFGVCHIGGRR